MDKAYADTVRLLLTVAPDVFRNPVFAMKGGTAINMFVRDMPRLSVDIDVVYTPWSATKLSALSLVNSLRSGNGWSYERLDGLLAHFPPRALIAAECTRSAERTRRARVSGRKVRSPSFSESLPRSAEA